MTPPLHTSENTCTPAQMSDKTPDRLSPDEAINSGTSEAEILIWIQHIFAVVTIGSQKCCDQMREMEKEMRREKEKMRMKDEKMRIKDEEMRMKDEEMRMKDEEMRREKEEKEALKRKMKMDEATIQVKEATIQVKEASIKVKDELFVEMAAALKEKDMPRATASAMRGLIISQERTKNELDKTKEELTETKEELTETKEELTETKDEVRKMSSALRKTQKELSGFKAVYELGHCVEQMALSLGGRNP